MITEHKLTWPRVVDLTINKQKRNICDENVIETATKSLNQDEDFFDNVFS